MTTEEGKVVAEEGEMEWFCVKGRREEAVQEME